MEFSCRYIEQNDLTMASSAVRRSRKLKAAGESGQMGLFGEHVASPEVQEEAGPHPVLEELGELDVDAMTPMEALAKLDEWKKKASGQASDGD